MAGDSHTHTHTHSHAPVGVAISAGGKYKRRLAGAFGITLAFFVVELVTGLLSNSLALLSDVVGLGMALAAVAASQRASKSQHSFGAYRLEILAALANAVLLFGVAIYVLYEAAQRVMDPPDVVGLPVFVTTGWPYIDPLMGAGIGLFILPRTYRLAREALRVLVQAAPPEIEIDKVRADLAALPFVVDVHDVHVWTLTSAMEVSSAHLMIRAGADAHAVLDAARALLQDRYGLTHATLQVEPDDHTGCEELSW